MRRYNQQLRNLLSHSNVESFFRQVDQQNLQFAAVGTVDDTRDRVQAGRCYARAILHQSNVITRDFQVQARFDQDALPLRNSVVLNGAEIIAGITRSRRGKLDL